MADTANYVVEATSDGGYVAGGQTVQCFKEEYGAVAKKSAVAAGGWINRGIPDDAVAVMMSECEEYFEDHSYAEELGSYKGKVDTPTNAVTAAKKDATLTAGSDSGTLLEDICGYYRPGNGGPKASGDAAAFSGTLPSVRLAEYDENAYYNYYCVDYIAKFKQDGTKEWLTTIRNGDMPAAVGETSSDYRLITENGMLYTFAKTSGDGEDEIYTDAYSVNDAIINNDGSIVVVMSSGSVGIMDDEGVGGKILDDVETDTTYDEYDVYSSPVGRPIVRTDDGFIITSNHWEMTGTDPDTGEEIWEESLNIVKVSNDLETVTTIASLTEDDLEGVDAIYAVSATPEGDVALIVVAYDEDEDEYTPMMVTINKDGEAIAAKPLDEMMTIDPDDYDDMPLILDNLTIVDPVTKKLTRYNADLTEIDSYDLGDGEMVYDAVVLTDSSMAAVGLSTASTDNYTVDGNVNGTYLRLAATKAASDTTNPQTGDDVNIFAISSVFAAIVAAGLGVLITKRR